VQHFAGHCALSSDKRIEEYGETKSLNKGVLFAPGLQALWDIDRIWSKEEGTTC